MSGVTDSAESPRRPARTASRPKRGQRAASGKAGSTKAASKGLSEFAYALLVLYAETRLADDPHEPAGRSPYAIEKFLSGGGSVLGRGVSSVYRVTKVLAEKGFLTRLELADLPHPRTHYVVTDKGTEALRRWFQSPAPAPPFEEGQVFIRLRGPGDTNFELLAEGLLRGRPDVELRLAKTQLELAELNQAGTWTEAARQRLDLQKRLLTTYNEWLDDVEKRLEELEKLRKARITKPSGS